MRIPSFLLSIFSVLFLQFVLSLASAQSSPSDYTYGIRYDAAGRVAGTISPDPDAAGPLKYASQRTSYNSRGLVDKVEIGYLASWQSENVLPANWAGFTVLRQSEYFYDQWGRKVKEVGATGSTIHAQINYTYDVYDRLKCKAVRMTPSHFNRIDPSQQTDPTANACLQYGTSGTFGKDRIERYTYDNRHQLTEIEKAVDTTNEQSYVQYVLNNAGKPIEILDAKGNLSKMEYDSVGRLQKWIFPSKTNPGTVNSGDYESYTYDADGNKLSVRRRDGQVIQYTYDALGRMLVKNLPGTTTGDVYFSYDLRNLQTSARFGSSSGNGISTVYDGFGRPQSVTKTLSGSQQISYQYDANGNRTRITHPDAKYFAYDFDGLDRLKEIKANTTVMIQASYDVGNQVSAVTRRHGANTQINYDVFGRLSSYSHDFSGSSEDILVELSHNPASQISWRKLHNDQFMHQTNEGVEGQYLSNGLNQYTSAGSQAYTYDARGNLTSDGFDTYTYDVENRLVSVSGTRTANLIYDPYGRLHETSVNGVTTRYLYDGDALIAEYNGSNQLLRRFVHGKSIDKPLIWYEGAGTTDSDWRFLHTDHQGSIIAISKASAQIEEVNTYNLFGVPASTNLGRFGFTGQAILPNLGLYYYKARIYDPRIGRFMQTDPIGYKDHLNLYSYAGNDPLNATDPTGLFKCCEERMEEALKHRLKNTIDQDHTLAQNGLADIAEAEAVAVGAVVSIASPVDEVTIGAGILGKIPGVSSLLGKVGNVVRGTGNTLGKFSERINEVGGRIFVSDGKIVQSDFRPIVEDAVARGEKVNILSGVDGRLDGFPVPKGTFYVEDVDAFGAMDGVTIHKFNEMTGAELGEMLNSSDTSILAFCHSAKCLGID